MLQAEGAEGPVKVEFDNFEHGFPEGFGPGGWGHLGYAVGIAFASFQLVIAAWNVLPSQVVRGVHVGFLILMTFGLIGNFTARSNAGRAAGWLIGSVGFLCGLYQWIFYVDLIARDGDPTRLDLVVGTLLAALIFEGTRRLMGLALPLMSGACLLYWFFGQYLPAPFNHRGYDFDQIVTHLSYGTEGFYGVPIYVSATYIFLFILFGSFLERAGMIRLFTDVALGLFGGTRGGPAKVAVFASGMMGTISGSGVANVVTVGQFTIPLMIKFGYRRAFAAGVEATASMGGQIMPPVMGAVAFIIAETLGVDYSVIVKAAVIPAILYFVSAFWMVHLEAGKYGLVGIKRSELPSAWKALVARWYLVLPLTALVYMLFEGFAPLYAGSIGLALTVMLILGASITLGASNQVLRYVFWIGLALVVGAVSHDGLEIVPVASVAGVLVLVAAITRGGRATLAACRDSLADSAKSALTVGMACAIVGSIIGMMTQTGVGTDLRRLGHWPRGEEPVPGAGHDHAAVDPARYRHPDHPDLHHHRRIGRPRAGQARRAADRQPHVRVLLRHHGRPLAAGGVGGAGGSAHRQGKSRQDRLGGDAHSRWPVTSFHSSSSYSPALMLQDGDPMAAEFGFYGAVVFATVKALIAIILFGMVAIGFLFTRMSLFERAVTFVAALCLLGDFRFSNTAGLVLTVAVVLQQWRQRPRNAAAAA